MRREERVVNISGQSISGLIDFYSRGTIKQMVLLCLFLGLLVFSTMAQSDSKVTVRLYVYNLPPAATEPDLKSFFNESGIETFKVEVVESRANGQPVWRGFVTVKVSDAEKAINLAKGKKFMDNTLTVTMTYYDSQKVKNYKKTAPTPILTPQPSPNPPPTATASPTPNVTPTPVTPNNGTLQVATPTPIKSDAEKQADELIGEYIQARGGTDKLRAINTLRFTGKVNLGQGLEAPFTMEMARPDKIRREFVLQGMTGIQTYDGKNGWSVSPFLGKPAPEPVTGSELESLRSQADFDGALIDYETKGYRVEFAGKEDLEGLPVYKLKLTKKNGEISILHLDAETHQLVRESHKTTINGQEVESETDFGDYKAVGGVLFAHSISIKAKGLPGAAQVMSIEKIEINPNLPDTRFGKP